jgi:hypothetical protein
VAQSQDAQHALIVSAASFVVSADILSRADFQRLGPFSCVRIA